MRQISWASWNIDHVTTAPAANTVVVANAACVDERCATSCYRLDAAICVFMAENVKHWLHSVQHEISERARPLVPA